LYKALGGGWQTNFSASASQANAAIEQSGEPIPLPDPMQAAPSQPPMPPPPDHP
jgi:hypothetical protein